MMKMKKEKLFISLVMVLVVRWLLKLFVNSGCFNNRYKAFLGIKDLEKRNFFESIDYVKCSCCNEDSLEEGTYCPNCGAKMEES